MRTHSEFSSGLMGLKLSARDLYVFPDHVSMYVAIYRREPKVQTYVKRTVNDGLTETKIYPREFVHAISAFPIVGVHIAFIEEDSLEAGLST